MEKYARNSSHELLRMIAMYMIVFIHANMYLGNFCKGEDVWLFCNGAVRELLLGKLDAKLADLLDLLENKICVRFHYPI